jgi:hypothetical protein
MIGRYGVNVQSMRYVPYMAHMLHVRSVSDRLGVCMRPADGRRTLPFLFTGRRAGAGARPARRVPRAANGGQEGELMTGRLLSPRLSPASLPWLRRRDRAKERSLFKPVSRRSSAVGRFDSWAAPLRRFDATAPFPRRVALREAGGLRVIALTSVTLSLSADRDLVMGRHDRSSDATLLRAGASDPSASRCSTTATSVLWWRTLGGARVTPS